MIEISKKPLGLYLHIPFCLSKCQYCGFYSAGGVSQRQQRAYVEGLLKEIEVNGARYGKRVSGQQTGGQDVGGQARVVDTIFIGGGTPSILPGQWIEELLGEICRSFAVAEEAEITIESNPKTLDRDKLELYRRAGINRLSMGLQSFDDKCLKTLGRAHTAADFLDNFRLARKCGFNNINVDLMFAVPGHTMAVWKDTLERAIELEPEHFSCYSLQIEEGTPFYDQFVSGIIDQIPDEVDREMYHYAIRRLREAGYDHYEISNWARPGYACQHNLKYWSMEDYLGFGSTASSFVGGVRFTRPPWEEYHENTLMDTAGEFVFTGLRKTCGIKFVDFAAKTGHDFWEVFGDRRGELEEFLEAGLLLETVDGLKLSEAGIDVSNAIMAVFVTP